MFKILTLALAASLAVGGASAATLIDTGTPTGTLGNSVDPTDFLATRFTASNAWLIDGVSAYLTGGNSGDQFALSLYKDAAGLPGELVARTLVNWTAGGWNGTSALGWALPGAGSYWLGVEGVWLGSDSGLQTPGGSFTANTDGLTMPGITAFSDGSYQNGSAVYTAYDLSFGLQVTGAVPEPATAAQMLAGLLIGGVVAARARRSR
jgi:hypothetical protein